MHEDKNPNFFFFIERGSKKWVFSILEGDPPVIPKINFYHSIRRKKLAEFNGTTLFKSGP